MTTTNDEAYPFNGTILIDQDLADNFLAEQLHPEIFEAACNSAGQTLTLGRHAGYDYGYFFISTFIEAHLRHYAVQLGQILKLTRCRVYGDKPTRLARGAI